MLPRLWALAAVALLLGSAGPIAHAAATEGAAGRDSDRWRLELTPYVWVFGIDGDVTAKGVSASADASIGDVLENFDGGAQVRLEGWRGRWGFYVDAQYLASSAEIDGPDLFSDFDLRSAVRNLDPDVKGALRRIAPSRADVRKAIAARLAGRLPPGMTPEQAQRLARAIWSRLSPGQKAAFLRRTKAAFAGLKGKAAARVARLRSALAALTLPSIDEIEVETTLATLNVGGMYRLVDEPLERRFARHVTLDCMAGLRCTYIKTEVEIEATPSVLGLLPSKASFESSVYWIEPVVGARAWLQVADRVSLGLRGDVGGFGLGEGSYLTWQLLGGIDYRLSSATSLKAGYRVYDLDYRHGDTDLDLRLKGPFVGVTIRF